MSRVYFPVQLPDGSTHVIGPRDAVVATFEGFDTTQRWADARSHAAELNRRRSIDLARVKVRRRWALIILGIAALLWIGWNWERLVSWITG